MRRTHEISQAMVHAMSRVRNTQSRAQDALTQQQGNDELTLRAEEMSTLKTYINVNHIEERWVFPVELYHNLH